MDSATWIDRPSHTPRIADRMSKRALSVTSLHEYPLQFATVAGVRPSYHHGRCCPERCSICRQFARVPFAHCDYCGASPSYHHGRCCPEKRPKVAAGTAPRRRRHRRRGVLLPGPGGKGAGGRPRRGGFADDARIAPLGHSGDALVVWRDVQRTRSIQLAMEVFGTDSAGEPVAELDRLQAVCTRGLCLFSGIGVASVALATTWEPVVDYADLWVMPVRYLPGSTAACGRPFSHAASAFSESIFNDWPVELYTDNGQSTLHLQSAKPKLRRRRRHEVELALHGSITLQGVCSGARVGLGYGRYSVGRAADTAVAFADDGCRRHYVAAKALLVGIRSRAWCSGGRARRACFLF